MYWSKHLDRVRQDTSELLLSPSCLWVQLKYFNLQHKEHWSRTHLRKYLLTNIYFQDQWDYQLFNLWGVCQKVTLLLRPTLCLQIPHVSQHWRLCEQFGKMCWSHLTASRPTEDSHSMSKSLRPLPNRFDGCNCRSSSLSHWRRGPQGWWLRLYRLNT
jgi:hypothetical protein